MKQMRFYILLIIIFQTIPVFGYNIQLNISGGENSNVLLAYYYGDRKFIKDSIQLNENGSGVFQAEETLPGGIYLLVLSDNKYAELLINEDDEFTLSTDTSDVVGQLNITGALESEIFLKYQKEMIHRQKLGAMLKQALKSISPDNPKYDDIQKKLGQLETESKVSWMKLSREYPETFTSKFLKAMMPPPTPDFEVINKNHPDSSKFHLAYEYTVHHYFDNFDFSDERLLRTPLLPGKLDIYFNRILIQDTEEMIAPMHALLNKPEMDENMFQFILSYLFNQYNQFEKVGYDDLLIEMAEKYYFTGRAHWANEELLKQLKEKVTKLKLTQRGAKAPDIMMQSASGEFFSLHKISSEYTILYFWEPNCGHCNDETPKLKELFDNFKNSGVEVFAVNTQTNQEEWTTYINQHKLDWINVYDPDNTSNFREKYNIYYTPNILLLDKNKIILAKNPNVRFIEKKLKEFSGWRN